MPIDTLDGLNPSISTLQRLLATNGDHRCLRPYIGRDGKSYMALNTGRVDAQGKPVLKKVLTNSPALLRKEEWALMDGVVQTAAKPELNIWDRIVGAGLVKNIPNAMSVPVLQHQKTLANATATLSMDGLRQGNRSRPTHDIGGIPIPIVHADFAFSMREVLVSRRGGQGLDTTQAEESARACAELINKLTLGTLDSYEYAGYPIYGLCNHPNRLTKALTLPTAPAWTPATFKDEIIAMTQQASDNLFRGPFGIFYSQGWDQYLQDDYTTVYNGDSLQARIMKIKGISWMESTDYLSGFQVVMFDLNTRTVRALMGMKIQTVSWESEAGMALNFKTMGIMVPEVRTDAKGDSGIVHGVAA